MVRSHAPATGEMLAEIQAASPADVHAVVARARKAQAAWAILPVAERAERVLRFRDAILELTLTDGHRTKIRAMRGRVNVWLHAGERVCYEIAVPIARSARGLANGRL